MAAPKAPEVDGSIAKSVEAQERAKILEGVDFIETEEDAEAVESAVVKIQSTFRGKKIRSKLSQKPAAAAAAAATSSSSSNSNSTTPSETTTNSSTTNNNSDLKKQASNKEVEGSSSSNLKKAADQEELSKKVATMQVNDNNNTTTTTTSNPADEKAGNTGLAGLPEEEAERAATKIQAGFKGYKTRKELEGKALGQQGPTGGSQDLKD